MTHEGDETETHLAVIRELAHAICDGTMRPYAAASKIWPEAMVLAHTSELGVPLWLLWAGLTDRPERHPEQAVEADDQMRDAAAEWLRVEHDDRERAEYFDRWLYDIIRYRRPDEAS